MMKNLNLVNGIVVATWLIACSPVFAVTANTNPHIYPSGMKVALQIGSDLYDSLDAKYRNKLETPAVCTMETETPQIALLTTNDDNKTLAQVSISEGYVDLINHIAHAKAVDKVQPGFFDQYMSALGAQSASGHPMHAADITEDRFWTDDVINDQASYFNQMMGMTIAMSLSHQYLGQFNKYAGQMQAAKLDTINDLLTTSEWEKGVKAAAANSLSCALGTEGGKALFDAIGKMTQRPAWTNYLLPQNIDTKRLNKQLAKYEVAFFHGGLN